MQPKDSYMALVDLIPGHPLPSARTILAHVAEVFGTSERLSEQAETERRDSLLDMMRERPDAFQCENDVQCMLQVYPRRY